MAPRTLYTGKCCGNCKFGKESINSDHCKACIITRMDGGDRATGFILRDDFEKHCYDCAYGHNHYDDHHCSDCVHNPVKSDNQLYFDDNFVLKNAEINHEYVKKKMDEGKDLDEIIKEDRKESTLCDSCVSGGDYTNEYCHYCIFNPYKVSSHFENNYRLKCDDIKEVEDSEEYDLMSDVLHNEGMDVPKDTEELNKKFEKNLQENLATPKPEYINIFGHVFQVKFVEDIDKVVGRKNANEEEQTLGECDVKQNIIYIRDDGEITPKRIANNVMHEVIHAILYDTCMDYYDNENLVQSIATGLLYFMDMNNDFFNKYIMANIVDMHFENGLYADGIKEA